MPALPWIAQVIPAYCWSRMCTGIYFRGKPYARTTILHELGHIFNNDLPQIYDSKAEYDSERREAIWNGTVHEREIRADAFAVRFLGGHTVSEGLARIRQNQTNEDGETDSSTVIEIDRRIELAEDKWIER